jgi:spore germination cell wall hydrolase CwlJ-like protein
MGSQFIRMSNIQRLLLALVLIAMAIAIGFAAMNSPRRNSPTARHSAKPVEAMPPPVEEQRLLNVSPETAVMINAKLPIVAGPLPAARPFKFTGLPDARDRAVDCLAAAGWYEAGDDAVGERAVMQVVLNRVRHPAFPASVCAVVFQGSERTTGCQFTFTCDGSLIRRTPPAATWDRARALAIAAIDGKVDPDVGYATHYHANYVVPYWVNDNDKIAQVGLHIFYRWKGFWGTRAAFSRAPDANEAAYAALARLSPAHAGVAGAPIIPDPALAGVPVPPQPVIPPAVSVEGVREKSLRGAVVRGQKADTNQFFLQLDATTFPGNYATAAVALCKGKPTCLVLGWRDVGQMGQGLPLTDGQRSALSFYFAQASDGTQRALWNCQQSARPNSTQCLPATGPIPLG